MEKMSSCDDCGPCKEGAKPDVPEGRRRRTYDINRNRLFISSDVKRILLRCERDARNNMVPCESSSNGPEGEFVDILTKRITEILEINWNARQTFTSVLKAAIGDNIKDLLDDYLDYWVEEYCGNIKREFDLGDDVKPNYTYAHHARLSPVVRAAKAKLEAALANQCRCEEKKKKGKNAKKK